MTDLHEIFGGTTKGVAVRGTTNREALKDRQERKEEHIEKAKSGKAAGVPKDVLDMLDMGLKPAAI